MIASSSRARARVAPTPASPAASPDDRRRPAEHAGQQFWFGTAGNPPGFRSLPHHHGEAETGAYVLSGRARVFWGENYAEFVDLSAGDFMFVPPLIPHLECNMSTTEELWWIACRTPENIVVNLPDIDDALLVGYRRA